MIDYEKHKDFISNPLEWVKKEIASTGITHTTKKRIASEIIWLDKVIEVTGSKNPTTKEKINLMIVHGIDGERLRRR